MGVRRDDNSCKFNLLDVKAQIKEACSRKKAEKDAFVTKTTFICEIWFFISCCKHRPGEIWTPLLPNFLDLMLEALPRERKEDYSKGD